jgi:ribosomal protein S27AE
MNKENVKVWPPQQNLNKTPKIGPGVNYKGVCPNCKNSTLMKIGRENGLVRYDCNFCGYKFRYNGH